VQSKAGLLAANRGAAAAAAYPPVSLIIPEYLRNRSGSNQ
jgi:hypothetical protein